MIIDSTLESDEEENEENGDNPRGRPVAKLCILKNEHISETELPLFLGDNMLGRDPNTCTLPLSAASVSKQHAIICISVYRGRGRHAEDEMEALLWDLGSTNGTRKGHLKLTPNVRYALSGGDSLVVADIPCQYVICGVDSVVSSQEDMRTTVSRNPSVKASVTDDLRVKEGDTCTGSEKRVNGGTKPRVSQTKTPVRASCLSFEQTPTHPQQTLVPESESDSDGETAGGGERRHVALVSESDSHKSSPICSTFVSPTNKVIPEREEERAAQRGTESKEGGENVTMTQENNDCTGEDELPVSTPAVFTDCIPAFDIDSDTDMEEEEEGVASAGPSGLNINQQVDQPPNTVQFHMDSDTDIEEDHDILDKVPSSDETTKPPHCSSVIQPEDVGTDSNTDVDEDADVLADAAMKAKPASFQTAQIADSASSMQIQDFHLDSGTDVDEEEEEGECKTQKTDETLNKLDMKVIRPESAAAAPHSLHADTDNETASSISEPTVAVRESCSSANTGAVLDVLSDSDTDVEDNPPVGVPAAVTACKTSDALQSDLDADTDVDESGMPPAGDRASLPHLRVDSDKDVEDKEAGSEETGEDRIPNLHRENTPGSPLQCQNQTLATEATQPFFFVEGDVISEDTSTRAAVSAADRLPAEDDLHSELTQAHGESEDSDRCSVASKKEESQSDLALEATQAYISVLDIDPDDNTNQDEVQNTPATETPPIVSTFAFAETQPMSFHIEENTLATDNSACSVQQVNPRTQTETEEREEHGEDAHPQERNHSEAQYLAATQPICTSSNEESDDDSFPGPRRRKTKPLQLSEEQSQCLIEREENGKDAHPQERNHSEAQYLAATQPICTSSNEDSDDDSFPGPRKRKAKPLQLSEEQTQCLIDSNADGSQATVKSEDDESGDMDLMPGPKKQKTKQHEEETQPSTSSNVSAVEAKPVVTSKEQDSDGSIPRPQRRTVKQRHLKAENQPVATCGDDDADSALSPRKRKAKHLEDETQLVTSNEVFADDVSTPVLPKRKATLHLEEKTQPLTSSEVSAVESQPLRTCTGEQSDGADVIACLQKRKANSLQLEDEKTQPSTSSDVPSVETQPIVTSKEQDGDDDDSLSGPQSRTVKQLNLTEDGKQQLLNSEPSAAENQPVATREGDDADSVLGPRKRKAKRCEDKTQLLTRNEVFADDDSTPVLPKRKAALQLEEEEMQPEMSTVDTQPVKIKTGLKSQKGKGMESTAETTRASARNLRTSRSREGEEQAACSVPPKRQTRGGNKTLQNTKDFRGKGRSDDENNGEEVKQAKQARGKKNTRQQKDGNGEKEMVGMEEKKRSVNKSEQKEGKQQQEREKTEKEVKETDERQEETERQDGREEEETSENERKVNKEKSQEENEEEVKPKAPARSRRSTRAMASHLNTQESKGSGRGRGARTTSKSPQTAAVRTSNRRATVAAGPTEQDSSDTLPQGLLSKNNSSNSFSPEVFSSSVKSLNRGRRGRKTEPDPDLIPAVLPHSDQNSASKPTPRGRKSRKLEGSSSEALGGNEKEKADSQQSRTTRGRQQASANGSECAATDETDQSPHQEGGVSEESLLPKRNVRGRSQKVLFTGVVDEGGEKVLAHLGGSMAKGIADMNCLVTDKVRRTVKFLCAVAKGVPIVTTDWLEKSGKAGSFLSPNAFVVKDPEQEKKFSFCLQDSLRTASSQPLLQGYDIHVTKSVKPEPVHMKDIISSSGASFLSKMPTSNKPQTVVISCEEDWLLCGPAVSASIPVVTAEFILTGILQQKLDFQLHKLSPPAAALHYSPAGGKGRGRRKT
uniref:Mediator of DNA damage checkpoint protein 1 n=1 Tax=Acanthochromis polyacanthus TaxID=80966 RepID=A0A3Q1G0Y0_9TELE